MLINILIFLKKQDLKPVRWQILRDLHFHRNHSIPDLKCNYNTKRLSITNWQNGVTFTWLMYYIMLIVCKKKNSIEYVWVLDRVQRILAHMYLHRIYFKFHEGGIGRPHLLYIWACFPLVGKVRELWMLSNLNITLILPFTIKKLSLSRQVPLA